MSETYFPRGLVQPCLVALCKKSTRNQPISNHHTGIPTVGMMVGLWDINHVSTFNPHIGKPTVGFMKTNRVPTFVYHNL